MFVSHFTGRVGGLLLPNFWEGEHPAGPTVSGNGSAQRDRGAVIEETQDWHHCANV